MPLAFQSSIHGTVSIVMGACERSFLAASRLKHCSATQASARVWTERWDSKLVTSSWRSSQVPSGQCCASPFLNQAWRAHVRTVCCFIRDRLRPSSRFHRLPASRIMVQITTSCTECARLSLCTHIVSCKNWWWAVRSCSLVLDCLCTVNSRPFCIAAHAQVSLFGTSELPATVPGRKPKASAQALPGLIIPVDRKEFHDVSGHLPPDDRGSPAHLSVVWRGEEGGVWEAVTAQVKFPSNRPFRAQLRRIIFQASVSRAQKDQPKNEIDQPPKAKRAKRCRYVTAYLQMATVE